MKYLSQKKDNEHPPSHIDIEYKKTYICVCL